MDSNPKERRSKIQRRIDRISELPDPILCKILRLLPTKNALATSILSTRWKNLFPIWDLTTPVTLNVDDSDLLRPDGNGRPRDYYFIDFVDKLFSRTLRNVHCIETMTLKCKKRYPDEDGDDKFPDENGDDKFLSWVSAAVRLNVQDLRLKCGLYDVLPLFASLNGCSKLTLESMGNFNFCFNGDYSFKPNKLKTLSLLNIVFGFDELSFPVENGMMMTLSDCCPELEELSLIDCDLHSLGSYGALIKFPRLRTLIIRNSLRPSYKVKIETRNLKTLELLNVTFDAEIEEDVEIDESGDPYLCHKLMTFDSSFPVLEELSLTNSWRGVSDLVIECQLLKTLIIRNSLGSSDRLTFNTPNLQLLLLNDCITNYNFVRRFNSLRLADIDVGPSEKQLDTIKKHNDDNEPSYYKCVKSLIRFCSDTRHLCLSTRSIEVLCLEPVDLPTFHNLASLKLGCLCRSGWKVLARLLCSAPYLEKLVLEEGFDECEGGYVEFESVVSTLPICLKLNLKEIDFLEFNDVKDGFKLIEYFLKNGEVMRKLKLQCRPIKNRNSLSTLLKLSKQTKVVITFASWKDEMLLEEINSHMA